MEAGQGLVLFQEGAESMGRGCMYFKIRSVGVGGEIGLWPVWGKKIDPK